MSQNSSKIKIKDVARAAGVSTATVSRALNKPETVAEATRNVVLNAARETGYRVNLAARNLRSRKTGAVMVLVPNLGNPFFSQILAGIESELVGQGYSVLIVDTKQATIKSGLLQDYLHDGRADGFICLDGSLSAGLFEADSEAESDLPIVFACEWDALGNFPSVRVNNRHGAMLAIRHLADLGHSDIGYLGGPLENVLSVARMEGFVEGMKLAGLAKTKDWFLEGDFSIQSGIEAAERWLEMRSRPTAMFCANDESAMGFISCLNQAGITVPGDVSVVGFDDIEVSRHFIPALTTISQPRTGLGNAAANTLMHLMKHNGSKLEDQVFPVELIIRESTGTSHKH